MAQGYYIESAGNENLKKYSHYVESCIAQKIIPLTYNGFMKEEVRKLLGIS